MWWELWWLEQSVYEWVVAAQLLIQLLPPQMKWQLQIGMQTQADGLSSVAVQVKYMVIQVICSINTNLGLLLLLCMSPSGLLLHLAKQQPWHLHGPWKLCRQAQSIHFLLDCMSLLPPADTLTYLYSGLLIHSEQSWTKDFKKWHKHTKLQSSIWGILATLTHTIKDKLQYYVCHSDRLPVWQPTVRQRWQCWPQ